MGNFSFKKMRLEGLILVTPKIFGDERGFFLETYQESAFDEGGIPGPFPQSNYSCSEKRVLRGLHYQIQPYAQGKLVRAVVGKIFDVAVDIRKDSPTYGQWEGVELSSETHQMLYIQPGFAHGFQVVSSVAHVQYMATSEYAPAHEGGLLWNDPVISIQWPFTVPQISNKDQILPTFDRFESPF